ncbi:peroxiredoxin [Bacillus sp. SL00103]
MELTGDNGEKVKLSDFKRAFTLVLYFYPKDMTPGCTTEACDFRDRHQSFAELDAVIIVSPDVRTSIKSLKKNMIYRFLLLVDDEQKLSGKPLECGS